MRHDDPMGVQPPAPRHQLSLLRLIALALASVAGLALAVHPASALPVAPAAPTQEDDDSDSDEDEEDDSDEDDSDEDDDEDEDVHDIGDTAHTADLDVTVHGILDPWVSSNEFDTPLDPNNRFVAVEMTLENTSDEQQTFSTLLQVELIDGKDRGWDVALAGYELPGLDTMLVEDQPRRGFVVFEIPPDATDLQIRVLGEMTANGSL